jgi:hypothetical protein
LERTRFENGSVASAPPRPASFGPGQGSGNDDSPQCLNGPKRFFHRWIAFSDQGREFHVYVVMGTQVSDKLSADVWAILDSLSFLPPEPGGQTSADSPPGDDLGHLDCPTADQVGRWLHRDLTPTISGEASDAAVRRTFVGIAPTDVVDHIHSSEAGQTVAITRNGAVVARVFVSPHLGGWFVREVTSCTGAGIRPPPR